MEIINLPGNDPLEFGSKALENSLRRLQNSATRNTEDEDLKKVSRELESVFVKLLLDTMDKTVPKEGIIGNSPAMETWKGLFYEKLAVKVSEQGSIGLADMIYRQLSKHLDRHREVPPARSDSAVGEAAGKNIQQIDTGKIEPPAPASAEENPGGTALDRFRDLIENACIKHGLDPTLVAAVIMQELVGQKLHHGGLFCLKHQMPRFEPLPLGTEMPQQIDEHVGRDQTVVRDRCSAHGGIGANGDEHAISLSILCGVGTRRQGARPIRSAPLAAADRVGSPRPRSASAARTTRCRAGASHRP